MQVRVRWRRRIDVGVERSRRRSKRACSAHDDWRATFVGPAWDEDLESPQPCPYLRREFEITDTRDPGAPVRQRARRVRARAQRPACRRPRARTGLDELPPSSPLRHVRRHRAAAATARTSSAGSSATGGTAARWSRTSDGTATATRFGLLCQLEVTHADGSTTIVVRPTSTWRATTGPIRSSGLYEGETYDARLELHGWSSPASTTRTGKRSRPSITTSRTLPRRSHRPIRVTERITPVEVLTSPSGKTIVDFGQNLVGVLELTVTGTAGTEITIRHAEVLQDGELCTEPLRSAEATDRYILRGGDTETWRPRFTFHGFRYAEVTGWPGELDRPDDITALVLHTDMRRTGWFDCSDERVNRLHENVVWGMRGNFVGIPTDCPQRDERLGWTGDIGVFAPTATFLYDCAGVLESWLGDLAAEQRDDGTVPWVIPDSLDWLLPAAVWGDAAVTVPSTVYERFGDRDILRAQYVEHAGLGGARAGARRRRPALDGRFPVRRLARSDRSERRCVRPTHRSRSAGHGGDDPLPRPGRDRCRAARRARRRRPLHRPAPSRLARVRAST